jgi:hypothetical protein
VEEKYNRTKPSNQIVDISINNHLVTYDILYLYSINVYLKIGKIPMKRNNNGQTDI